MSETRITNERTGGEKGAKPQQLHHLDWNALLQVGAVASHGGDKYSPYNYRRGINYSLHFDALMRHIGAWWEGEDIDPESGQHHVAHAAWHCLALLSQARLNEESPELELDDRPGTVLAAPPRSVGELAADTIASGSWTITLPPSDPFSNHQGD